MEISEKVWIYNPISEEIFTDEEYEALSNMLLAYAELTDKIDFLRREMSTLVSTRCNLGLIIERNQHPYVFVPNFFLLERIMKDWKNITPEIKEKLFEIRCHLPSDAYPLNMAKNQDWIGK